MSWTLTELAEVLNGTMVGVSTIQLPSDITSVVADSRNVTPGALFVAVKGESVDGHTYVGEAFSRGASAAVVEDIASLSSHPGIVVSSGLRAVSSLASFVTDHPSRVLSIVGVTGTNGKTTTTWLISQLMSALGVHAASIGTIGVYVNGCHISESSLTTPDALGVHGSLLDLRARGVQYVSMEVSSHGLHQGRVDDVWFDTAVFTNLTRDHLDYHRTMDGYRAAKERLFALLQRGSLSQGVAVIYNDDPYTPYFLKAARTAVKTVTFGEHPSSDVRLLSCVPLDYGSEIEGVFFGRKVTFISPLSGHFNALNLLASLSVAMTSGMELSSLLRVVPSLVAAPGRLERVPLTHPLAPMVYVDYAHTPDALQRALEALKGVQMRKVDEDSSLWVVFGCGGDRDKGKRSLMGKIASTLADKVVVTSDNPRTEEPGSIIGDIVKDNEVTLTIVDRREAILYALSNASPHDVVLIAGKGHEEYQIVGKTKHYFSDADEVRAYYKPR
jgi:UDP-N-acetylmuramyl-tripeptide synthetase